MVFKVGDFVRVKDYKDIGWCGFVDDMIKYCGYVYKIESIDDNNYYELEGCKSGDGKHYVFKESCLEKAVGYLSENEVIALFEQLTGITDQEPIIFRNSHKMEDKKNE